MEYAIAHVACQAAREPAPLGARYGTGSWMQPRKFSPPKGFAGATIDAIGQAAGFTKGAVYSNFESKDELFLALLDREFELRGEQIATALESGGDTAAAAQALSRSVLDSVHGHADYYVLFVEYWLRAVRDPELRERLIARRHAAAADQAQQHRRIDRHRAVR